MTRFDRRWLLASLLFGAGVIGWIAAFGVDQGVGHYLRLPDDAELTDLAAAAQATAEDAAHAGKDQPPEGEQDLGQPAQSDMPPGGRSFAVGTVRSDWVDPIVERNIFDSSKVGVPQDQSGDISEGGHRTDLKIVLLATVVAEPDIYSSALIAEESDGLSQGYGVGDELMGEATIFKIEQKKVYLKRNDGSIEYVDMEMGAGQSGGEGPPSGDGDVASADSNHFVVERSMLDEALKNPEALAGQIRVVPHKGSDGEIDGYRLSGIRKGSMFEKLGIKNGDIVHSVNGKALTSTNAALDAYNGLQNENSFSFEITRRSKRQTMEYEVH